MEAESIYNEITDGGRYLDLYKPLVMRICAEEYVKYKKDKDRIKAVKNRLHLCYGAFMTGDGHKKAHMLLDGLCADFLSSENGGDALKHTASEIMRLHASTSERQHALEEFYRFIYTYAKPGGTVLDIGCGFNPFTVLWHGVRPAKYYAYDIDIKTAELNNRWFKLLGMPELAGCMDIITETPFNTADTAFLFKLLPVVELQRKGRGLELISALDARVIVITYPLKTLCGRGKGQDKHYAEEFSKLFNGLGSGFSVAAEAAVGGELVCIIRRETSNIISTH